MADAKASSTISEFGARVALQSRCDSITLQGRQPRWQTKPRRGKLHRGNVAELRRIIFGGEVQYEEGGALRPAFSPSLAWIIVQATAASGIGSEASSGSRST